MSYKNNRMSHSTLSAQLSSLHSRGTVSSRQHNDAVGRGIHHSSKVGHTILNKNPKHKPSVLYPDSRAAASADVPLATLRENAIASLQYLSRNSSRLFDVGGENLPWKTLFGPKSIKFERGLNTKDTNAKFDNLIEDSLYLLSSVWGDAINSAGGPSNAHVQLGANKPSSVLHTLEYLIQKYYAHVYNTEALLVAFLPHHESFLFDRILQLIDLAKFPQWSFLRPYSAARGINGVPRTAIAKWAASRKDNGGGTAIVVKICEIAKRAARIHARERKAGYRSEEARRGVSACISFAAATIAETMHIQQNSSGFVDEAFLRIIIPVVLNAIDALNSKSSKKKANFSTGALCPEWRSFGRIVISLIAESCDLKLDLEHALIEALVKGCKENIMLCIYDDMSARGEEFAMEEINLNKIVLENESLSVQRKILEALADTMISIMSILHNFALPQHGNVTNEQSLFKINPNNIKEKEVQYIGYDIPSNMIHTISEVPFLSVSLGYLLDKNIDITAVLASIFAHSISMLNKENYQRHLDFLIKLVSSPSIALPQNFGKLFLTPLKI